MSTLFRYWSLSLLLLTFLVTAHQAQAQIAVTAGPDSSQVAEPRQETVADSLRKTEMLFGRRVTRPTKAAVWAIIPGGGQAYNRKYWKIPLAVGLIGGVVAMEVYSQTQFHRYVEQRKYLDKIGATGSTKITVAQLNASPYPKLVNGATFYGTERSIIRFRRYRDQFIAYSAVAYGLTVLDALVDAHLKDFDISDDLSLNVEPAMLRTPMVAAAPGVSLTFSLTSTRSFPRK
ncbi:MULTISPECIES: DUF5683 domain-containing protein [Hymenobacter]|uniref:DUF5683 domain-containing protein n=2 Tax=Hymenobacter TaxID=89966 RepID=A0ABS6WZ98_9BACT|nr:MULTISPECIES: DUF5683 domain-containing protein [Hymenobacter]MBO3271931.1 hypothetical protein [Hymenobacter defluvii]MBW3128922.1 hypothetical protein [Hymenobacter profundi]